MAVEYERFFPEVLPYLPDVGEPSAIIAIRNACIEFCDTTHVWQESIQFTTAPGQLEYPVAEGMDYRRAATMRLWCDGRVLTPYGKDTLTSRTSLDWRTRQGRPSSYVETNGTIMLVPVPDAVYTVTGEVSYTPTRDSLECGWDDVYEVWLETIAAGAIARLAAMMGSPHYNPTMAEEKRARFLAGVSEGKIRANIGFGRGRNQIQMRPFGRGAYPWR